jgi:hypothetical protein
VDCDEPLTALQRSQTAVHFSEVRSALDITQAEENEDPRTEIIHSTIEEYLKLDYLEEELIDQAERVAGKASTDLKNLMPQAKEVSVYEIRDLLKEMIDERTGNAGEKRENEEYDEDKILIEEWPVLTQTTKTRDRRSSIIVREDSIEKTVLTSFLKSVHLVDRLREVRVFRGFRRVETTGPLTYPNLGREKPTWLPAIEVYGEGFFLEFDHVKLKAWENAESEKLEQRLRPIKEELSKSEGVIQRLQTRLDVLARFIVLHTFSHALMRQLCYECGYSGASLRERLYAFDDKTGVLIYTADGDSEGSLGGLVRQGNVELLQGVIFTALERIEWCSNDPICREMPPHGPGKSNRATCHACTLASETSCTEFNALLDRELLIGEGSSGPKGFFWDTMKDRFGEGSVHA